MTRTEHGIRPLPPVQSAKLEAAYAAHRGMAIVARGCNNPVMARHHALKARQLVQDNARIVPFSAEAGRLYLRGAR